MKDEQINNETKEKNKKKELTLKDDIVFKAFFARKGNEEFLKDFLEALLKIEIREITIRSEVDLERLAKDEKGGSIDLQAELNDGIIVNVEMQVRQRAYFENRTLHYGANYGGVLQCYALQEVLKLRGHDVEVLSEAFSDTMGHAGAVSKAADGSVSGSSDPRCDGCFEAI